LISFRDYLILNEIFDYTSNYKEVNKNVYIDNWKKFINKENPEILKQPGIDLKRTVFDNHGPRVHYYTYDNFLIFYGKFKSSNKYEVHFWDIKNLEHDIIGSNSFNKIFSAVMSIIKDKHIDAGKLDYIYIKNEHPKKLQFYKTIIDKILKKYNMSWGCTLKGNNIILHPEKELEESTKLMKPTIY
jgi:hypothetical protein